MTSFFLRSQQRGFEEIPLTQRMDEPIEARDPDREISEPQFVFLMLRNRNFWHNARTRGGTI